MGGALDRRYVKIDNFFVELKRRNVYKVAVAYAMAGRQLVEVATPVFPFFEVPNCGAIDCAPKFIEVEDANLTTQSLRESSTWIYA